MGRGTRGQDLLTTPCGLCPSWRSIYRNVDDSSNAPLVDHSSRPCYDLVMTFWSIHTGSIIPVGNPSSCMGRRKTMRGRRRPGWATGEVVGEWWPGVDRGGVRGDGREGVLTAGWEMGLPLEDKPGGKPPWSHTLTSHVFQGHFDFSKTWFCTDLFPNTLGRKCRHIKSSHTSSDPLPLPYAPVFTAIWFLFELIHCWGIKKKKGTVGDSIHWCVGLMYMYIQHNSWYMQLQLSIGNRSWQSEESVECGRLSHETFNG